MDTPAAATLQDPPPNRPTPPQRLFATDGSPDDSIPLPRIGEAIMLRLPFDVVLGPPSIISSAVSNATGANYHLCFVSAVNPAANHVRINVWVCLSFSAALPTPYQYVQSLSPGWQACLLPIPFAAQTPPMVRLPTPTGFGAPLDIGGFLARKPCFLTIKPSTVLLDTNAFKRFDPPGQLSPAEVRRLFQYTLDLSAPSMPLSHDHSSSSSGAPGGPDPRAPSRKPRRRKPRRPRAAAAPGAASSTGAAAPAGAVASGGAASFKLGLMDCEAWSDEEEEAGPILDLDDVSDGSWCSDGPEIAWDAFKAMVAPLYQKLCGETGLRDARREVVDRWLEQVE